MSNQIVIILDYGVGNVKSIQNMFKKVGLNAIISSNIDDIKNADKYILAGVGSFDYGINNLRTSLFFSVLEEEVLKNKKPILGICLGMQLLTNGSEEGNEKGLGWIDADTVKFDFEEKNLVVPHMGWNKCYPKNNSSIFNKLENNKFYFVHSYHVICNNKINILATANYGNEFVCSIHKNNIYGVQFHPEKSHKFGMQLFKNFGDL